jgi:Ca-activated chloride channel family protein
MRALTTCLVLLSAWSWCARPALSVPNGLATQDPRPGRAIFSARADLAVLHVSVTDRRSGLVSGLPREAFTVYEDGHPRNIDVFLNEDSPATVGLVIDASTSMHRKREAVIAAGMAFSRSTHPRDEVFTVHFNERVWFGLPPDQPFTSEPAALRAALEKSTARGRTALFDAVAAALRHIERGSSPKKALLVVSDGGDNSSRSSFAELRSAADRTNVLIYTVCLTDEYDGDADPETLERLSHASGALAFAPREVADAPKILERIARDIHGGYTIGYVPGSPKDRHRDVRVEVSAPGLGRMLVRTRSGYGSE